MKMYDVFLSYSRRDAKRAEMLAKHLEQRKVKVFWDRNIPAGAEWIVYLKNRIDEAGVVVVVWTKNSIESKWVEIEAREGVSQRKLLPVFIDEVDSPFEFGGIQAVDMTDWGPRKPAAVDRLLHGILRIKMQMNNSRGEANIEGAVSPMLEQRIVSLMSYGRQLGWIQDALAVLIEVMGVNDHSLRNDQIYAIKRMLQAHGDIKRLKGEFAEASSRIRNTEDLKRERESIDFLKKSLREMD